MCLEDEAIGERVSETMKRFQISSSRSLVLLSTLAIATLLSSCGKQSFVVTDSTQKVQGPGSFTIAPKVDLIFVEDDTGSIFEAYDDISKQVPVFLSNLQTKGWDFHFATVPLTTDRALDQILASKHDGGWGPEWTAPYPGAIINSPGTVNPIFFVRPENYTGFITDSSLSVGANGSEPGFRTLRKALYEREPGTGLIRNDALTVVFIMGNGDDTSDINYCPRADGIKVPCEAVGNPVCTTMDQATAPGATCGSSNLSFEFYKSLFRATKSNPALLKFFSATANKKGGGCLGGYSYVGTRYQQMATSLGGQNFDICSQSISSVLDSLSSQLQGIRVAFRTRYLFIDKEPNPATIKVTKFAGGDPNQPSVIPEDASNGWKYVGKVSNVFSIDSPIAMNLSSGYAIELSGSAKLVGEDTAQVDFKPFGAKDSTQ